jgi:hypothetical protein
LNQIKPDLGTRIEITLSSTIQMATWLLCGQSTPPPIGSEKQGQLPVFRWKLAEMATCVSETNSL